MLKIEYITTVYGKMQVLLDVSSFVKKINVFLLSGVVWK